MTAPILFGVYAVDAILALTVVVLLLIIILMVTEIVSRSSCNEKPCAEKARKGKRVLS